jgi:sulfatase maturation enzyme AslB (radical SAM superfamily)
MCYTAKDDQRLSKSVILDFVDRYQQNQDLETITLCGGELFLMQDLSDLVNQLVDRGVFVQLITNGLIDRLCKFNRANQINLIVSLDGLPDYHDLNRGHGSWRKSIKFIQHADELGFHLSVFSIVTKQNFEKINQFEQLLEKRLGFLPDLTYHPRKSRSYLSQHPKDNRLEQVENFEFIADAQQEELWRSKKTFPPYQLGCYQLSVFQDGMVYGCCEATQPLGKMEDPIQDLIKKFKRKIASLGSRNDFGCLGCAEPNFVCGLKRSVGRERP